MTKDLKKQFSTRLRLVGCSAIIVITASLASWHVEQLRMLGASATDMPAAMPDVFVAAKTIAPARVIPPDVSKNMQTALAEREKKLRLLQDAQLAKTIK